MKQTFYILLEIEALDIDAHTFTLEEVEEELIHVFGDLGKNAVNVTVLEETHEQQTDKT